MKKHYLYISFLLGFTLFISCGDTNKSKSNDVQLNEIKSNEQSVENWKNGLNCYNKKEYECAKNYFKLVVKNDSNYELAQKYLVECENILVTSIDSLKTVQQLIRVQSARIKTNIIGNPEINISVKNYSNKIIDSYVVETACFNNFGDKVKKYNYDNNVHSGIDQTVIRPGQTKSATWTLYGLENTTNAKVSLVKFHFKDGETINVIPDNYITIATK